MSNKFKSNDEDDSKLPDWLYDSQEAEGESMDEDTEMEESVDFVEESESEDENQNGSDSFKAKVIPIRAFVFNTPSNDVSSRPVTKVAKGNLLSVIDEEDEFFKVRIPRTDDVVVGWIQKSKLQRI